MKIIKIFIEVIHMFLENLSKEEDLEQDFRRNFSVRYSYSNNTIKNFSKNIN